MNCPKCHGRGQVRFWNPSFERESLLYGSAVLVRTDPCDHPGCHAGQISCAEGENRDEAAER